MAHGPFHRLIAKSADETKRFNRSVRLLGFMAALFQVRDKCESFYLTDIKFAPGLALNAHEYDSRLHVPSARQGLGLFFETFGLPFEDMAGGTRSEGTRHERFIKGVTHMLVKVQEKLYETNLDYCAGELFKANSYAYLSDTTRDEILVEFEALRSQRKSE